MNEKTIFMISIHADPSTPSGTGDGGGTHAYIRELMSGLVLRGRHVVLITRWALPSLPQWERISDRSEIFRIKIGPVSYLDKGLLDDFHKESKRGVYEILNRSSVKPVVLHSVYWNSGRVAMDISRELGINYVHTVISNGLRRKMEGALNTSDNRISVERSVFQNAFRIFSVSRDERNDLVKLYGVRPEKIVVVGRPVSKAFISPAHDETGIPKNIVLKDLNS